MQIINVWSKCHLDLRLFFSLVCRSKGEVRRHHCFNPVPLITALKGKRMQSVHVSRRAREDSLLEFSQLLEAFPSRRPFLTLFLVPRKTEDDLFFCV